MTSNHTDWRIFACFSCCNKRKDGDLLIHTDCSKMAVCFIMTLFTCHHLAWRYSLSCVSLFISNADGEVEVVVADRGEVMGRILFPGIFFRSKGITPHISSPRSFCARRAFISIMDDVSYRLQSTFKLRKKEKYKRLI
jgi:hypothetical protein